MIHVHEIQISLYMNYKVYVSWYISYKECVSLYMRTTNLVASIHEPQVMYMEYKEN